MKRHLSILMIILMIIGMTACNKVVKPIEKETELTTVMSETTTTVKEVETSIVESTETEVIESEQSTETETQPTEPETTIVETEEPTTTEKKTQPSITQSKTTVKPTETKKTTKPTTKPTTKKTEKPTTKQTEPKPTETQPPTTTTTKKVGRPITKANMVAMINEERARIGNPVKVSYGDATQQKIADIRAEEQKRLRGHTRPMPCPGCDYCHGEKECISNESGWIYNAYGEKYSKGSWAGGIRKGWTVEDFLEFVKTSPGHYNQLFRGSWTKFAFSQTAWGTLNLNDAYFYISCGTY